MTKRSVVLILVLCSLTALLAGQALSQTRSSNRSTRASDTERRRKMTDAERKKEAAENRRQWELKEKELAKEGRGPLISRKQRHENLLKKEDERSKEFFWQKAALVATEEQWKLIKPKLEKVRQLRDQATSAVGLSMSSGSSDNETNLRAQAKPKVPTWQWHRPWKDKAPDELTEAQKLTKHLIALVENKNTTPEQFRRTMVALRKARREEAELERQLSEAREELREGLTPRQEAALVLMQKWL